MDAKNTTSIAIAAGLVAAFVLGGITFAIGMPLTRAAAGVVMGAPAFVASDRMGPGGHGLAEIQGEAMMFEGRGYGLPGEPSGMRGEMRGQLPEDHPRLEDDGAWNEGCLDCPGGAF
jgi:hypothetical protein